MSEPEADLPEDEREVRLPPRRRWLRRWLAAIGILLILALGIVWAARERIANSIIAGQLQDLGIPGTYEIESIGPRRQVLRNVVIGDPAHPDMTIARATVGFEPRFGVPVLGRVELEGARLFGTWRAGKLSFGRLDRVIFDTRPDTGPKGLPDLELVLVDARARIAGDAGVIGLKAQGRGNLRNAFAGSLAAYSSGLALSGCTAGPVRAVVQLTTSGGKASLAGPLRLDILECPAMDLAARDVGAGIEGTLDETFTHAKGRYTLESGGLRWQGNSLSAATGKGAFAMADGDLVADYRLVGNGLDLGVISARQVEVEGALRSRDTLGGIDGEGKLRAADVRTGKALGPALARLQKSGEGSLLGPLVGQLRSALQREERGARLRADYTLRQSGRITHVMLPSAELIGGSGARLMAVNRFSLALGMAGGPRFSGRFMTGDAGLPKIEGVAQRQGAGGMEARLSLTEYRVGTSAVALPDLRVVQLPGGQIGFAGRALVSGPLPGGEVRGLAMPVEGNWSARTGLSVWRRCTAVAFDRLVIGSLALGRKGMILCPGPAGAIVRSDAGGLRIAAGTAGLDLAGTLGTTPVRLKSGAIGAAWPGAIAARNLAVVMGPADKPSTITVDAFNGQLGKVLTGRFTGTAVKLFAVPLDVSEASGALRFAGGVLDLSQAALKVSDRQKPARFYTLVGRDATLHLANSVITAETLLREPGSDRAVVLAAIHHNLATATGHADLKVPGILFDGKLQPDTLSYYASGVIALAKGTVTGTGRIDWNPRDVTSSGTFDTDGLDFAAAFGPVKGVKGTVRFADLLNMVTAPDQQLGIGSINPGIEVFDGTLIFQIEPGRVLVVKGAQWPFIDGKLLLLPTRMVLGNAEVRRFTLKLEGANAAKFVQQLDLANINATGVFDGTVPLVFDQEGGRIENGLLTSRPPGGNVSYVGELTYKDLSAMGNFVFQTLRSLNFRKMEIGIDGKIDGDIVTRIRMEGVRQGEGAKRNFLTRQIANLPIRFNVNIRAPFYQLVTSFKSFYDPAYVRDPRSLGLIDAQGQPTVRPGIPVPPPEEKSGDIQHPDSRNSP